MIRRSLSIVLCTIAVAAASLAWAGWLYLHTAADPTQGSRMVNAVLTDAGARHAVATDISDSVATAAQQALTKATGGNLPVTISGSDPAVIAAVEAALANPQLAADLTNALTALQAGAMGAPTSGPAVLHADVLNSVVRQYVATSFPAFADRVPALPPTTITLPAPQVPIAGTLRTLASNWVNKLALLALACFGAAFALGRRPQVLRRAGLWAMAAGISWTVLPHLATWAAGKYSPASLPIVRPAVAALGGSAPAVATALLVTGLAVVVGSVAWSLAARRTVRTAGNHAASTFSVDVQATKFGSGSSASADQRFGVRPVEPAAPATAPAITERAITTGR